MAIKRSVHGAVDVPQIVSRTFTLTWATADTATLTDGNGNSLVVTLGTTQTPAGIAAAVAAAFNLSEAMTATTGPADGSTSNIGGQSIPDFAQISASVSGATVTFTAREADIPHTISVTVATAGNGDVGSETVVQAASGKRDWANVDNWNTGSVPANGDTAVLEHSAVRFEYNLPNASLEIAIDHYATHAGMGLPPTRTYQNGGFTVPEYRQRYVRLDDAGSGSEIQHRVNIGFGEIGGGQGATLFNLKHTAIKTVVTIFGSGQSPSPAVRPVNVVCGHADSELHVLRGVVSAGTQDGTTAVWNHIRTAYADNVQSDVDLLVDGGTLTGCDIDQRGGKLHVRNATCATLDQAKDTTLIADDFVIPVLVSAGTVIHLGTATIGATSCDLQESSVFDASKDTKAFTFTNCLRRSGSSLLDPYRRATFTNGIIFEDAPLNDGKTITNLGRNFTIASIT